MALANALDRASVRNMLAEVIPGLWVGGHNAASALGVLKQLNIRACVNCTEDGHAHPSQLRYYHIAVSDSSTVDIVSHVSNLLPWVERQLSAGDSVLIYCKQGVSRSCTVMLALLLHLRPTWSLFHAWQTLKRVRKHAKPNHGFLKQLQNLEHLLRGEISVQIAKHGFVRSSSAPSLPLQSARQV